MWIIGTNTVSVYEFVAQVWLVVRRITNGVFQNIKFLHARTLLFSLFAGGVHAL